ncbi:MAG: electron transfer flavoprotein subunit alpha/FixB family protein, partial [Bdellovibrionales bacterium]|nr:electron transfer flavoprotein subunit alpha/FixB family protein [Bdellovibrionales bacterium]
MKVLVYCETRNGKMRKGSLEILGNAAQWGVEVHALLVGGSGLDSAAQEAAGFGAAQVHVAEHGDLGAYSPEGFSQVVADAARQLGADVVIASHSVQTKDFLPRVAVKLETGMASDCTEAGVAGGSITAKRPVYSGKCLATVDFSGAKPAVLSVRSNALGMKPAKGGSSPVAKMACSPGAIRAKVAEFVARGSAGKVDLTEADRIVSGGRSLKSAENFKILEDLAASIGATVGASRAAVDAGYAPNDWQVGQTGKVVAPELYIAVGISGAIQHLAGMKDSKVIVAINKDEEAPIFQVADYGLVG